MTATNHYLVGVAISSVIDKPVLAIPLAFVSHFILDALPHFGDDNFRQKLPKFYLVWRVDFILLCLALIWTLVYMPWWYTFAGFIATSPDLAWVYRLHFLEKYGKYNPPKMNKFNHFHYSIQKFESLNGIYFEIIFGVLVTIIILQ